MDKKIVMSAVAASLVLLSGCQSTGDTYRADTYYAGSVNQAQEVKTVQIVAILPARVAVPNRDDRSQAQAVGAVLGALAGIAIGNQVHNAGRSDRMIGGVAGGLAGMTLAGAGAGNENLVDGVQITFRYDDKLFNSAQVGRVCEFKPGTAIMVSPSPNETRIQPNNPGGCPKTTR